MGEEFEGHVHSKEPRDDADFLDDLEAEPPTDVGPIKIPEFETGGCLGLIPEPFRGLIERLLITLVLQEGDGLVTTTPEAAAILLTGCWRFAPPVFPEVCQPVFQTTIAARGVKTPNRKKTAQNSAGEVQSEIRELEREIQRIDQAIRELRRSQASDSDTRQARITALEQQRAALEARIRELQALLRAAQGSGIEGPPVGEKDRWGDIRAAGLTIPDAHICFFWKEVREQVGNRERICCLLRFIRVVPRGQIFVDSRKRLFIHKTSGQERKTAREIDRMTDAEKANWLEAFPWSVEAHEREHVKDFRDKLAAYLSKLVFFGAAENQAELVAQQRRIENELKAKIEAFTAQYTLEDMLAYPHGESESAAIREQREVLNLGADGEEAARLRREADETLWEAEIAAKIEAEQAEQACPLFAQPMPNGRHCLRKEEHSRTVP